MGDADMADSDTDTTTTTTTAPAETTTSTTVADSFPANTPLEQMTGEQREAYWKHQARKHEQRVKDFNGLTPDELKSLREKAQRQEALEDELASDRDKAVKEASKTATAERDSHYRPLLVRARIEATAAGRIEPDRLDALLEPLDMSKFLTDSGDVDADKVSAYVNGIAPEKGNTPPPRGPGVPGATRTSEGASGSVSAGKDLWNRLNPNKAIT